MDIVQGLHGSLRKTRDRSPHVRRESWAMGWRIVELNMEIGDVCVVHLTDGVLAVEALFFPEFHGRAVRLRRLDIQGTGANTIGWVALRDLARAAMEFLDVDEIRIEGSARTSGAGRGRTPAPLVFRRAGTAGAPA